MKISFLSDTHGFHRDTIIESCDILCYSGDATNIGELIDWVEFFEWLRGLPAKHIVWTGGNHDRTIDFKLMNHHSNDSITRLIGVQKYHDVMALVKELPSHIHYLENQSVNIEGINIYGSPFSPTFGHNWAFNKDRGDVIAKEWAKIPKNTNILLTHTPPYRILDKIEDKFKRTDDEDTHVGCKDLLDRIKFYLPELRINSFGHIHDNAGCIYQKVSNKRRVLFINACVLDNYYNVITRHPITINYD